MADMIMLGTGTGIPTQKRGSPGILLKTSQGGAVLVDPGPGALLSMVKAGVPVEAVKQVLITHHHMDHTLDLMALFFARKGLREKMGLQRLTLLGPKGTQSLVQGMRDLYGDTLDQGQSGLQILELNEGRLPPETGLEGFAFGTHHQQCSLGYRLHLEGKILAVSGDSGPCEDLAALGREADLFLLECGLPDQPHPPEVHLTPSEAGKIAQKAMPRRLLLYHLYPWVQEEEAVKTVRNYFPGEVAVAEDQKTYSI